jgi:hypothetical protein
MRRMFKKIIKWLYWKLKCNKEEPWASQIVLYAIPHKMSKKEITTFIFEVEDRYGLKAKSSCVFPLKEIENY